MRLDRTVVATFLLLAAVPLWRLCAPLWFDEVNCALALSGDFGPLDVYLACNGSLWGALYVALFDPRGLSPLLLRLPQILGFAAAGALLVAVVRGRWPRLLLVGFWLLYMPTYHYASEGKHLGYLVLASAIVAAGTQIRSNRTVAAGAVIALGAFAYGPLLSLGAILLGLHRVRWRTRFVAAALVCGLMLWMGKVFPLSADVYPPTLRDLIAPETHAGHAFKVEPKALAWLVGSERPPLLLLLAAAWVGVLGLSRATRVTQVAVFVAVAQVAVMIYSRRVMHLWNMFEWAPLFALAVANVAALPGRRRLAAWTLVSLLLINAAAIPYFYTYRGPRPMVGIDTTAWAQGMRSATPDTTIVLSQIGPVLGTMVPVVKDAPQRRVAIVESPLALGPMWENGFRRWLRADQQLEFLASIPDDAFGPWAVFVWDFFVANPCLTDTNPCLEHFARPADAPGPPLPLALPPNATITALRGGYIITFTGTAATLGHLVQQIRQINPYGI